MFLDEKGDEWLPLGKSFQEHVKLYIEQYVKDLLLHSGIYIVYICSDHYAEVKVKPYVKRIIDSLE